MMNDLNNTRMVDVRNIPFIYQRNGPIVLEKSKISDESEDQFKSVIQEISSEITSVTNNLLSKAYITFSNELKLKTDKIKKLELQVIKYKERIKELEVNLETPSFVENKENSNYNQRSEKKASQLNIFKESFNYNDLNNHQESMQKNVTEVFSLRSPNITNLPQQHLMSYQAAQSFGLSYQMQGDRSKSNSISNSRQAPKERALPIPVLHDEVAQRYTKSIVDKYVFNDDLKEATLCVQERFKGKSLVKFVRFSMEWVIDTSSDKRKKIGILYHHLLRDKIIYISQFFEGCRGIIENISNLEIDTPQLSEYMGEVLCRLLDDGGFVLSDILTILQPAGPKMSTTFGNVLKQSSKVFGERKVTELWKSSKLALSVILSGDSDLTEYTNRHGIEFLLNESATNRTRPIIDEEATFEPKYVREKMLTFFKNQATDEDIFRWINDNVGPFTNENKFVRALTTALLESLLTVLLDGSVILTKNFEDKLKEKVNIIDEYVDNNQLLELPCIYGMQTVCVKYEHPPGFLEQTFNAFYDMDVISEDSFIEWENSNDPEEQLGKGVCITSVKKFLLWIKTEETDQSDSVDD